MSSSLVAILAVSAWPGAAQAVDVVAGQTVANVQLNDGETLVVEPGGTVDAAAGFAVEDVMAGSTVGIVNGGLITGNSTAIRTLSTTTIDNSGTVYSNDNAIAATIIPKLNNAGDIIATGGSGVLSGDILLIVNSGLIDASVDGIEGIGTVGTVINTGTIIGGINGIQADDFFGQLVNAGTISGQYGVRVTAANLVNFENSGTIEGTIRGIRVDGLFGGSSSGRIAGDTAIQANAIGGFENSGEVAGGQSGIVSLGTIDSIVNSGSISGTGQFGISGAGIGLLVNSGSVFGDSVAVYNGVDDLNLLINSGKMSGNFGVLTAGKTQIINSGTMAGGVGGLSTTQLTLDNSGSISTKTGTAISADEILSINNSGTISGGNAITALEIRSLTNSGLIAAETPAFFAIDENTVTNTDTLLTLNANSVIVGRVDISGGTDTLRVGDGLNLALTFDTSVPEFIETYGKPYTVVGTTVYVADPAAFLDPGFVAGMALGVGQNISAALRQGYDERGASGESNIWLNGFGGVSGKGNDHAAYGAVSAGIDTSLDGASRVGVVGGGAKGGLDAEGVTALYAGVYGSAEGEDASVEASLIGGRADTATTRLVANNTVASGIEAIAGAQDAWFVAPSLTVRKPLILGDINAEVSLRLDHTGVFASAYAESGPGALAIGAGTTHILAAKALLSLPYENAQAGPGMLAADLHGGVVGQAIFTDGLSGSLAGSAFTLPGSTVATAGLTGGAAFDYDISNGPTLFGSVDGTAYADQTFAATAEAGIKGSF